jgi:hypothetical protein
MGAARGGKTFVFSVPVGRALPHLPVSGVQSSKDLEGPEVVKVIEDPGLEGGSSGAGGIYPGPDVFTYAFVRRNIQGNLYRIPLP